MKNKVILVHPKILNNEAGAFPLSCLALAATLEQAGFEPVIYDQVYDENYQEFMREHIEYAICVGVSAFTGHQIKYGLEISDFVRQISPNTPIVWGGRHATALPHQTVSDARVDIVVRGEGDLIIVELVKALRQGDDFIAVNGITYKQNGKIISNPNAAPIMELDSLPHTPWHFIDIERMMQGARERVLSIQTGRGCPMRCTFCSHKIDEAETYRAFSAQYILDNIEDVVKKYRIEKIDLYEPFFIANQKRVKEFCQGVIDRNLNISWTASARANNFPKLKNLHPLLKKSGCYMLTFGFESGSQRTLGRIDKRIKVQDIIDSVLVCKEYDIIPDACFITGFPFESLRDCLQTLQVVSHIRKLNPNIILHLQMYTAFPASILYEESVESFGLKQLKSLEEWGEFDNWKDYRPWLSRWQTLFFRMLRGSIYASSLDYLLKERPDMKFRRLLHYLAGLSYNCYHFLFNHKQFSFE